MFLGFDDVGLDQARLEGKRKADNNRNQRSQIRKNDDMNKWDC